MFMHKFCLVTTTLIGLTAATSVAAQELYKYVDKNGKVTYSDVKPKPGEKATKVNVDHKDNVLPSTKKLIAEGENNETRDRNKDDKKAAEVKKQSAIESAEKKLAAAKKALEAGQERQAEDVQIIVRQNYPGASGANTVIPKPEYLERVARLEAAVKEAAEGLAKAKDDNAGK